MTSLLSFLSRASSATLVAFMKHWTLFTVSGITLCGLTSLAFCIVPTEGPVTDQRKSEGPGTMEEVTAIADALGLYSVGFPLNSAKKMSARLSVRPISLEQCEGWWVHDPNFEHWRGVVAIMWGGRWKFEANFDPAHPKRFALWGKWFVYGDPELIAKLLSFKQPACQDAGAGGRPPPTPVPPAAAPPSAPASSSRTRSASSTPPRFRRGCVCDGSSESTWAARRGGERENGS
jgi:hypothetical protein